MIEFSKHYSKLKGKCRFKGCIFADHLKCSNKIVKAHSIQKNKILNNIADKGMIYTFDTRRSFITKKLEEIGINEASTFYGFCNYHDTIIFSDIENKDYNNLPEQKFLFAYRACAREYVAKKESLCITADLINRTRTTFFMSKYMGEKQDLKDIVNELDKFHSELYKSKETRNYNNLISEVFQFPYETLIAVNSAFSLPFDFNGRVINDPYNYEKKIVMLYLNIFPQNNNTIIILSCFSSDFNKFKDFFFQIRTYNNLQLENLFSQLIIVHCENFFLSPERWKKINVNKRKKVVSIFKETLFGPPDSKYLATTPPINLFQLLRK